MKATTILVTLKPINRPSGSNTRHQDQVSMTLSFRTSITRLIAPQTYNPVRPALSRSQRIEIAEEKKSDCEEAET
jgi:hypothetical protein